MNQFVIICITLGALVWSASLQAETISVQEAIGLAVVNHPEILKTDSAIALTKANRDTVASSWRPQVDVTALGGLESGESDATRKRPGRQQGESGLVTLGASDVSLSITQKIFDGFAIFDELSAAGLQTDAATARKWLAAQTVGEQTARAYGEVLIARARLEDASHSLELQREFLEVVKARIRFGASKQSDREEVKGRIARFAGTVADLEARLADASATYAAVVGVPPQELSPVETLDLPCFRRDNEEQLLTRAPAHIAQKLELKASEELVAAAQKRLYSPSIVFQGGAGESFNRSGTEGMNRQAQLALVGKINLYRGGGDQAAIDSAIAERENSRAELEAVRRDVIQRFHSLNARIAASDEIVRQAKRRVAALQRIKDSGNLAFQVGTRSVTDLLNIELELVEAKSVLVEKTVGKMVDLWAMAALKGDILSEGQKVKECPQN